MTPSSQISRLAVRANLATLLEFIDQACARAGLDEDTHLAVRLAAEEACTNVIEHAYAGLEPGPVELELDFDPRRVRLVVQDRAPPFAPAAAPAPDLVADWASRPLGGLGLHLMRNLMDELRHRPRPGGGNRLELVKRLDNDSSLHRKD